MSGVHRIRDQVKRNAVALISLVIAVTSLLYNTWRNEHTENNRNQRWASFEVLLKLGDLQELIFLNHYDCNSVFRGNARTGWAQVQTIKDLSLVVEESVPDSAEQLFAVWSENWQGLDYADAETCRNRNAERREQGFQSTEAIKFAIDDVRKDVLEILYSLD